MPDEQSLITSKSDNGIPRCPWCGSLGQSVYILYLTDHIMRPALAWECGSSQFSGRDAKQCQRCAMLVEIAGLRAEIVRLKSLLPESPSPSEGKDATDGN